MIQIIEANIKYLNSINLRLPSALLKLAKVLSSAGDAFFHSLWNARIERQLNCNDLFLKALMKQIRGYYLPRKLQSCVK